MVRTGERFSISLFVRVLTFSVLSRERVFVGVLLQSQSLLFMPEIWIAGGCRWRWRRRRLLKRRRQRLDQMHRAMGFRGGGDALGCPTESCVETQKAEITESAASSSKSGRGSGWGFVLALTLRLISHLQKSHLFVNICIIIIFFF